MGVFRRIFGARKAGFALLGASMLVLSACGERAGTKKENGEAPGAETQTSKTAPDDSVTYYRFPSYEDEASEPRDPSDPYEFTLELAEIDDEAEVLIDGKPVESKADGRKTVFAIASADDANVRIEVRLTNKSMKSSLYASVKRDGILIDYLEYEAAISRSGLQLTWAWEINALTGLCRRTRAENANSPSPTTFCAEGLSGE